MPIFLEPRDALDDLKGFASVLIVSCPICPPMSVSIQAKRPLFEPLRHGAKTEAFEEYIRSIRQALEARGVEILAFVRVTSGRQHFFGQRAASGIGVRIGILLAT